MASTTTKEEIMATKTTSNASQRASHSVSAATFEKYLKGISFPTSKTQILQTMKRNKAAAEVLEIATELTNKEYSSVTEITKEFSSINQS